MKPATYQKFTAQELKEGRVQSTANGARTLSLAYTDGAYTLRYVDRDRVPTDDEERGGFVSNENGYTFEYRTSRNHHAQELYRVVFQRELVVYYDVQVSTGYGWETVTTEPTYIQARTTMQLYRREQPGDYRVFRYIENPVEIPVDSNNLQGVV